MFMFNPWSYIYSPRFLTYSNFDSCLQASGDCKAARSQYISEIEPAQSGAWKELCTMKRRAVWPSECEAIIDHIQLNSIKGPPFVLTFFF